jgi:hypothetical protein
MWYKNLKDIKLKIKNHSNMFWIVCDPSSGSIELYLTEITCSVSEMFVVCLIGVSTVSSSQPVVPYTHTPLVQNYAAKHRPSTRQTSVNHYE